MVSQQSTYKQYCLNMIDSEKENTSLSKADFM